MLIIIYIFVFLFLFYQFRLLLSLLIKLLSGINKNFESKNHIISSVFDIIF
jgi:hypothetical protein